MERAAVGEWGGGSSVGSNEPPEGVSTTASALGLLTLLYLLKVIWIWGDFLHATKKTKETKSNMLQFKVICHSGFSFFATYTGAFVCKEEEKYLKMGRATEICETTFLEFNKLLGSFFESCQRFFFN